MPARWSVESGTPVLPTASPRACRASMAPATLTAGLVILVCIADLPPVSWPAPAGEFRVYGFRGRPSVTLAPGRHHLDTWHPADVTGGRRRVAGNPVRLLGSSARGDYGGGCAGCAMVGRGLVGRGPGADGQRVDDGRRAPALVLPCCADGQRAGRAGCRRPVGDDAGFPGRGRL